MTQGRQYNVGFDILKILMAFVIVSLHAGVSKEFCQPISTIVLNFQNLAVPVFFVLSSCLFFDKFFASAEQDPKAIFKYERRLLILYIIWSVIMIPITLLLHHYQAYGIQGLLYWIKDFFFDYTFYASWFFGALLVGMAIVFLLRNQPWILLFMSVVLYIIFTFYTAMPNWVVSPFEWYHQHIGTPSRSFPFGIVWIGMGCLMSRFDVLGTVKQMIINRCRVGILCLGLIASCAYKPFQIVGVFSVISMFYAMNGKKMNQPLWIFFRKCSIVIYCVHYVFIHLLWTLHIQNGIAVFLIASAFSLAVASLVAYLSGKKCFKSLRYLY